MNRFCGRMLAGGVMALLLASPALAEDKKSNSYEMLQLFGDVFERVKMDYVEEVGDEKLVEAAINGMLTSLDPHSSFLSAKAYKDMQVQTKGEFGGLGIEVTMEGGLVKVVSPIDDTPAFKAGIKAKDLISHIDNEPVMGLTLNEAVEKMRGKVGSKIDLTVLREGETEPLQFSIMRAVIKIQSVRQHAEKDIGYVRITSFSEQTFEGLKKAIESLEKEMGRDKVKGYVLDLRNNPGGLLDQAIAVADGFLDKGEIVSTRGRTEDSAKRFNARDGDIVHGLPVVVLVNGGSASASEIVAGALQDHKRAVVMGTKSFGKGSVQTVIPIPEHGAIRLTTSRYYTPSGRSIQAEGIEPDINVEPSKVVPLKYAGLRKEADLKGHLTKGKTPEETPSADMTEEEALEEGVIPEDEVKDYQLQRALDFLRGVAFYQDYRKG